MRVRAQNTDGLLVCHPTFGLDRQPLIPTVAYLAKHANATVGHLQTMALENNDAVVPVLPQASWQRRAWRYRWWRWSTTV